MDQSPPELKTFKVTNLGEVTFTDAPSRQSIIEDLQRMQCLDKDTLVEEVVPDENGNIDTSPTIAMLPTNLPDSKPVGAPTTEPKYFTMPGGHKIKDDNGVLYGLEWKKITVENLIGRAGCEDLKIEGPDKTDSSDMDISVLVWIELKPEGNKIEDATETATDVLKP